MQQRFSPCDQVGSSVNDSRAPVPALMADDQPREPSGSITPPLPRGPLAARGIATQTDRTNPRPVLAARSELTSA